MRKYFVTVPATLALNIRVEAESVDDAIEKAFSHPFTLNIKNDPNNDVIIEDFNTHQIIAEGNVFHGCINEISVECEDLKYEEEEK